MKIDFERTGGFVGIRLAISLDLDELPVEEARILQELLEAAGLFQSDMEEKAAQPNSVMDRFQYNLSVERDGVLYSLKLADGALTEAQLLLVNDLSLRARSQRRP